MIDPGPFASTAEGIDASEELAAAIMQHMVSMTGVARLDTTITCALLLSEALAALEVYAGLDAPAAIARVQHITAEKVAALRAADQTQADQAPPVPVPAVPVPSPRVLH
jgi:hypothetical protein